MNVKQIVLFGYFDKNPSGSIEIFHLLIKMSLQTNHKVSQSYISVGCLELSRNKAEQQRK